jgi:DNA polymerase I
VKSKNYNIRQFGERAATNAPVQGSAADIIKIAMIPSTRNSREGRHAHAAPGPRRAPLRGAGGRTDEVRAMVTELMEGAFDLDVPLKVESGTGGNWYECK